MSIMNPLPPQAYTKETLVQAYAWLQAQSEHIREIATTPDVLVSLFLKAKMQGDGALERPSIQNFKNELKNLAGMMGEFEILDPTEAPLPPTVQAKPQIRTPPTYRFRSQDFRNDRSTENSSETVSIKNSSSAPASSTPTATSSNSTANPSSTSNSNSNSAAKTAVSLDSRSLDMIQEVRNQFNLSSDTEAMRMLVAVGYSQVKTLLK